MDALQKDVSMVMEHLARSNQSVVPSPPVEPDDAYTQQMVAWVRSRGRFPPPPLAPQQQQGQVDTRPPEMQKTLKSPGRMAKFNFLHYNVDATQCAKCGLQGHFCFSDRGRELCIFGKYALEKDPCPLCRIGGHKAEHCVRVARPKAMGN